jgi:outer membrane protein, heavy metal efflux system
MNNGLSVRSATAGLAALSVLLALSAGISAASDVLDARPLPDPLTLAAMTQLAREHRDEIAAARARASAAYHRPAVVSALDDPMFQWSLDHYPFEMMDRNGGGRRSDRSVTIEQRFPLSGIRGHRRRSAEADAERLVAEADRVVLDVTLDAVRAFVMLYEQREMLRVAEEQHALARQLVGAAGARYGAGQGGQADVLRAEVELARIEARLQALVAEVRAAEAMLNASLARPTGAAVSTLYLPDRDQEPPPQQAVRDAALQRRPELRAGAAEVRRADAELGVMQSMYRPMAMIRAGTATTMAEGDGAMLMIGVSVPLWRGALRSGVAEAAFMQDMAHADLAAMQRMVEGEAAAAREQVQAARAQFLALRDNVVPRAHMAIEPALAAYRSGQDGMVSVIEATRALWAVEAELVMAKAALRLAWARLERATGTGAERVP